MSLASGEDGVGGGGRGGGFAPRLHLHLKYVSTFLTTF